MWYLLGGSLALLVFGLFFASKNRPVKSVVATPQTGHYDAASLEDRFAERAMVVFMQAHKLRAKSLEMDYELVANASYEMARAMLKSRSLWHGPGLPPRDPQRVY
jgi:hypothetical protein